MEASLHGHDQLNLWPLRTELNFQPSPMTPHDLPRWEVGAKCSNPLIILVVSQTTSVQPQLQAKLLQSCPTLCNPMDYSPPGSSVHRIFQTRILQRVAIPFSRVSSRPRNQTHISCTAGSFLPSEPVLN